MDTKETKMDKDTSKSVKKKANQVHTVTVPLTSDVAASLNETLNLDDSSFTHVHSGLGNVVAVADQDGIAHVDASFADEVGAMMDQTIEQTPSNHTPLSAVISPQETPAHSAKRGRGRPRIYDHTESTAALRERLKAGDNKDMVEYIDRLHAEQLQATRKAKFEILQAFKAHTNRIAVANEAMPVPLAQGEDLSFKLPLQNEEEVLNVFGNKTRTGQLLTWIQANVPTATYTRDFFSFIFAVKLQENSYFRSQTRYFLVWF
jgi:hypothetical protein